MATRKKTWQELKDKKMSREKQATLRQEMRWETLDMDLRAVREMAGCTQVEVAAAMEIGQAVISRLEKQDDHLTSTLKKYVEALGGELEVVATFGDKRVRLRSV